MIAYYFCPVEQGALAARPQAWAPRVARFLTTGGFAIHGGSQAAKGIVFCVVDGSADELAAIDADAACVRIPFDDLDATFGTLAEPVQTAIISRLGARRIPTDWIGPATTLRAILRYVIGLLHLCGGGWLGADFPEVDLAQTFSTLPAAQRTRLRTWATAQGYSLADAQNTWTIRQVLHALIVRYPRWPAAFRYVVRGVEVLI